MPKQVIFDKKNVLVAGGAGFIGSHLCDELIKTNKVICVDNFISGTERNIDHLLAHPDFVFINHDLNLPLDLESIEDLKKFKVEFQGLQEIYNLACPMSPKNFLANRLSTLLANSVVVKNLLDLSVKYQAKFLQFSSAVVYGPRNNANPELKFKEDELGLVDQLSERSSYDEGKRFSETVVANYRSIYNIDARIIRLFRVYGPRMAAGDDQIIPDYINSALENKDIVINGDANFSSSFCYIDDVIDAVFKLMNSELAGPVNVGSDVDTNLTDLVNLIKQEAKAQSNIVYADSKLFISELILPDINLAKNELGWMPVVTLSNGLKKTIFDLQANKRLQGFGS
ncbi:MAG: NAD-dependent epimerase/dehydratase family protein [Patescibacteria group bacterium]|jgi:UDP-glucuronate decarboxylase